MLDSRLSSAPQLPCPSSLRHAGLYSTQRIDYSEFHGHSSLYISKYNNLSLNSERFFSLTTSLGKKLILPTFQLDVLV